MHRLVPLALLSLSAAPLPAQTPEPATVAERTGYQETSRLADVQAFLAQLADLPEGDRLQVREFGRTQEDRPMVHVAVRPEGDPDETRLRVLINANIHAGEVEGKEAVQVLLREIAQGEHGDLLQRLELHFVPIYNVDGNERIDPKNRSSQNGPLRGVGIRPNAQGLDLNRDFVKVESPECAALLGLCGEIDPHLFMDLHTTNGSFHGYHLTYAPSLSTNIDPALDRFARETLLPEIRTQTAEQHGYRVFDYGNFSRRGERRWATYDHRPRFGTNYYGLRNRFAILSEAYSYADFATRVAATRAFVLESLRAVARHEVIIRRTCEDADRRAADREEQKLFGFDTTLGPPEQMEILVGSATRIEGPEGRVRVAMDEGYESEQMSVQRSFRSASQSGYPRGWLITEPSTDLIAVLQSHGLVMRRLDVAQSKECERFVATELRRARRRFQGHHELSMSGAWRTETVELPAGTLFVTAAQRLSRVAAQLLEPRSEDSLATWGRFDDSLPADASAEAPALYPVLRLVDRKDPSTASPEDRR